MEISALLGTFLAFACIVGGQILEGGSLLQLAQLTAAVIVIGGTVGAVLLSFPWAHVRQALRSIPRIYFLERADHAPLIDEIVGIATLARKEGVLAVEAKREQIQDPLLRKSIKFVIDGFDPDTVEQIIEADIDRAYEQEQVPARVFEGAGGYAPTIGILGAVLGLIHVMMMLSDPTKIGEGIAVAFVATLYGVGLANLILLPWASKLKRLSQGALVGKEIVRTGVLGIQSGVNPYFLKEKLNVIAGTGE